jgi:hypothetical protein
MLCEYRTDLQDDAAIACSKRQRGGCGYVSKRLVVLATVPWLQMEKHGHC